LFKQSINTLQVYTLFIQGVKKPMMDIRRKQKDTVGNSPIVASNGKGATNSMQTSELETTTTWKRIGRIERHLQGMKISFPDLFGVSHPFYICQGDIRRITDDRVPGDVVKIDETSGGDVVISIEGRAYRSRSGQALILKVPGFAGAEVMAPWKSFLAVLGGLQQAAPLSVIQRTERADHRRKKTISTLPRGLAAGWF
jgi:hypothetical protein